MKKSSLIIAIAFFISLTLLTSCQTQEKKIAEAKEEVKEANEDLKEALKDTKTEAEQTSFAEEWKLFKTETELNIRNNDARIIVLKEQMKQAGKRIDATFQNRIDTLQMQNNKLLEKINSYNNSKTNWETFKREFNSDMNNLGKALKDFTINNKK